MKTPVVPRQKSPVTRFVPRLNQPIGVLWLWGTKLNKRSTTPNEPLLEVFPTRDVAETLRSIKSQTGGPQRFATHIAFEPFETFDEAEQYANQAIEMFEPENQKRPVKTEHPPEKGKSTLL